jgi:hypothetical protein
MTLLTETEQALPKFVCTLQRPQMFKAILYKRNKSEDITIPDFKTYFKAAVANAAMRLA